MTFGPDEMSALKDIVLGGKWQTRDGGGLVHVSDLEEKYIADLIKGGPVTRKLKVVCACGNGTAGAFAPKVLEAMGVKWYRWIVNSIIPSPAIIPTRKTWKCCMPCAMQCLRPVPMLAWDLMGMATAAAWWTMRATRFCRQGRRHAGPLHVVRT